MLFAAIIDAVEQDVILGSLQWRFYIYTVLIYTSTCLIKAQYQLCSLRH